MSDTVTIGTIDTSTQDNGYVTVPVSISISGTTYTPDAFTVGATDVPSIVSSIKQQAEQYRTGVLAAIAANPTAAALSSIGSLDGQVIDL